MYKENIDNIKNVILQSKKPVSQWAQDIGVTRQTIYSWLNSDKPIKIRSRYVKRIQGLLNNEDRSSSMDIRDQIIKSQEMNIALLTEKISVLEKDLISKPPPQFDWTESSAEKFAVELNADSTFQEIANELHIKSEQWNYLFDNINQPLVISRKGIVREVNQMCIELLGYGRNELVGKHIMDFVHPDEHERLKKAIASDKSDFIWRSKKKNGQYCKVQVQRQNFGDPIAGFTVSLMKCVDEGCKDIK